jgi:DNA-binding protein YbaB
LIGKRDPKRVKASQEMLDADPELLEAVLAASGSDAKGEKGAKQRKA